MFRTQLRQPNALYDGGPVWENNNASPMQAQQRPSDWAVRSGIAEAISPTMGAYGMGNALGATSNALMQQDWAGAAEAGLPLAMAMVPMWGRPKGSALATGDRAGVLLPHQQPAGLGSGQQGHMPALSESPQGLGSHTNSPNALLSNSSTPPSAFGILSSEQALRNAVKEAISANDGYYGLRITEGPLTVGEKAPNSRQWYQDFISDNDPFYGRERFPDHNQDLGGPSTYGVTSENAIDFMLGGNTGAKPYTGNHYSLIRSDTRHLGRDPGEWILPDGNVVATWERPGDYKSGPTANASGTVNSKMIDDLERRASTLESMGASNGANKLRAEIAKLLGNEKPSAEQPKGIRAYHGSPHDFDKFDMSKIGTGEGAQAYGHGLYFAENEGVAKSYREQLTRNAGLGYSHSGRTNVFSVDGAEIPVAKKGIADIAHMMREYSIDPKTAEGADWLLREVGARGMPSEAIAEATALAAKNIERKTVDGRMYEVNIKADPEHFLDWDKPLSQQSGAVRKAIGVDDAAHQRYDEIGARLNKLQHEPGGLDSPEWNSLVQESRGIREKLGHAGPQYHGEEFAKSLLDQHGKDGAAKYLREAGIPGIKYLDQGSRGAGEGSRNYVVFDPATIEIMRKYGLLGPMAGGVAAGALQQSPNALYGDQ